MLRRYSRARVRYRRGGSFTGRLFRMKLNEGWIGMEHVDGRRKAFIIITGGTIRTQNGEEIQLPSIGG